MSEHLSRGPNLSLFIGNHESCRNTIHAALSELKATTDEDRIRLAAQRLIESQTKLADTYEQVATAYIDAGMVDSWIDDFIHEDERAIWRMFEDVYIDELGGDDDMLGDQFFTQMSPDEMRRLALEHTDDITTPQPVYSINGYIAPEFTGKRAIKYEYEFKINGAISNFAETLPESTQVIVAQEYEIHQFSQMLNQVDSPLEFGELLEENMDDGQVIIRMLERGIGNPLLSNAVEDYEKAKSTLIDTFDEIPKVSYVQVTKRHKLYRDTREYIKEASYHFELLCEVIYETYGDSKTAARVMAALWRQDNEMYGNMVRGLSLGSVELPTPVDAIVDVYAEYFMNPDATGEEFGGNPPSRDTIIGYYTDTLERANERIKNLR